MQINTENQGRATKSADYSNTLYLPTSLKCEILRNLISLGDFETTRMLINISGDFRDALNLIDAKDISAINTIEASQQDPNARLTELFNLASEPNGLLSRAAQARLLSLISNPDAPAQLPRWGEALDILATLSHLNPNIKAAFEHLVSHANIHIDVRLHAAVLLIQLLPTQNSEDSKDIIRTALDPLDTYPLFNCSTARAYLNKLPY